jgi:flagellar biosynthesis/type III secretory pathway M-ring protein FliF/YscJ
MGISTLVTILLALLIGIGLRAILRDWRRKFAEDETRAEEKRKAQIERNKAELKSGGVVNLERGEDGVYRPGKE